MLCTLTSPLDITFYVVLVTQLRERRLSNRVVVPQRTPFLTIPDGRDHKLQQ